MPLPPGFTSIKDTNRGKSGDVVSLLGIIVSLNEPRQTRGSDWFLDFTIQDDFTSGTVGTFSGASINCRLFRPSPTTFPKISGVNDVVILRKFKLNDWHGRLDCVSDKRQNSGVLVFPASKIPVPELSQAYQLGNQRLPHEATFGTPDFTTQEQMAVIHTKHAASGALSEVRQFAASKPFKATASNKLSLIKDLTFSLFYDVRAQLVNIYYTNHGTVELKVTDYTSNRDLHLYADPDEEESFLVTYKNWSGPYGTLTLDVILYGSNANWARDNLSNGDYIFLKNMRTKMSPANRLEGVMHDDKINPDQVDIRKLTNSMDINEIIKRREAYEKQRTGKSALEVLQSVPQKPSAKEFVEKKTKKREKQRLQKETEQKELQKKYEVWDAARNIINGNVVARDPDIQLSTISEIIYNPSLQVQTPSRNTEFALPFVNCKHRARVRVVDFFPPRLELFARSTRDPTWNEKAKAQTPSKERWEWSFVLLLEDAKPPPNTVSEKLRVVVGNDSGQYLTKLNAVDLKKTPNVLERLEEIMFILWGNVFELKTELRNKGSDLPLPPGDNRLQNKPFDCNIVEYGAEVPVTDETPTGYERKHMLYGTTIRFDP
ncbi:hypothetical protein P153DRAFT_76106 [Dothidotthia symphoricarpi CBS 119687]|uniref:Protection of telomeres protein 1 n=1 Tax=Dothidotthia symphoricarpi CBS 119687 TaxID=1392245 RepID=A0A6A6A5B1_9PLEO|nr:uncharacterized protein P153DRAFT_76106 [Dothidotthia symphoricarpi CBS 119687]KAF2126363.1 hypothetical protein P153DRAFT_76106 [Dothidotthia symphoricarpi CBS 119687]